MPSPDVSARGRQIGARGYGSIPGGVRGRLDRIEASGARTAAQLELASSAVAVIARDRRRQRWRVARVVLAVLVTAAAGLGGGAYV